MQRQVFDSLIAPVTRSLTRFEPNGAESCSCNTRLTGINVMLNFLHQAEQPDVCPTNFIYPFQHLTGSEVSFQNRLRITPDSRIFNLTRYCSLRRAQTHYLPLLRGEGRGEVLTIITQSPNHLVTFSDSLLSTHNSREGVRCSACLFTPEVLSC